MKNNDSIKWPIVGTTREFLSEFSTISFIISLVFCFKFSKSISKHHGFCSNFTLSLTYGLGFEKSAKFINELFEACWQGNGNYS